MERKLRSESRQSSGMERDGLFLGAETTPEEERDLLLYSYANSAAVVSLPACRFVGYFEVHGFAP